MKVVYKFVGVVVLISVVAFAGSETTQSSARPVDWFHCGDRQGNLVHPRDCTKFIMCTAGGDAFEFDCPTCDDSQEGCTAVNRLIYNITVDKCLWAHETKCTSQFGGGGGVSTITADARLGLINFILGISVLLYYRSL